MEDAVGAAAQAIETAAAAVAALANRPTDPLARAMKLMLDAPGRVIVTGLGKSGLVGAKIAATLSSTHTPHACEAPPAKAKAAQAKLPATRLTSYRPSPMPAAQSGFRRGAWRSRAPPAAAASCRAA